MAVTLNSMMSAGSLGNRLKIQLSHLKKGLGIKRDYISIAYRMIEHVDGMDVTVVHSPLVKKSWGRLPMVCQFRGILKPKHG